MARAPLLVGNAQAFWGDDPDAPARLIRQQPDLDFLTLDYLAEVSLSIMAIQREKDPLCAYARDFVGIRLEQLALDRVLIEGATGRPPISQSARRFWK